MKKAHAKTERRIEVFENFALSLIGRLLISPVILNAPQYNGLLNCGKLAINCRCALCKASALLKPLDK